MSNHHGRRTVLRWLSGGSLAALAGCSVTEGQKVPPQDVYVIIQPTDGEDMGSGPLAGVSVVEYSHPGTLIDGHVVFTVDVVSEATPCVVRAEWDGGLAGAEVETEQVGVSPGGGHATFEAYATDMVRVQIVSRESSRRYAIWFMVGDSDG